MAVDSSSDRSSRGRIGGKKAGSKLIELGDRALAFVVEGFLAFVPAVVLAFVVGSWLDLGLGEIHYVAFGFAVAIGVAFLRSAFGRSRRR